MSFESYTECLRQAYELHPKQQEILKRKKEIFDEVAYYHNHRPSNILYVGFNPLILIDDSINITVTEISKNCQKFLKDCGIKFNYIEEDVIYNSNKRFDVVIALDEYFTFANDDEEQKNKITKICKLTNEYIITTCKDYKNQDFKDKEFSVPGLIKNGKDNLIFLEFHDHSLNNKTGWITFLYKILNSKLETFGPFNKKIMFFKQLAKFSHDAGAVSFHVHKNLMYKSLIKKNYEHVISIRFDNGT